jgi:flagellar FliL protein
MADEDKQEEGKRKLPLVKILLLVVVVLLVLVGAIGATLFLTGYFDQKDEQTAEAQLEQASQQAKQGAAGAAGAGGAAGAAGAGEPQRVTKASPEVTRFEYRYHEYARDLLANLTNSRKVMQVQVAFMTRYDDRVVKNLEKHEFALRSVALDLMRQTTEADLEKPDFRKVLAERLRTELNAVLEKFEDFGGIEEVYFTSFVVQ